TISVNSASRRRRFRRHGWKRRRKWDPRRSRRGARRPPSPPPRRASLRDRNRLPVDELELAVAREFAAVSGRLHAAERQPGIRRDDLVHEGAPAVELLHRLPDLLLVVRPKRR